MFFKIFIASPSRPSPVPQDPCQSLKTLATPSILTHIINYSCAILKALAVPQDPHQSLQTLASPSRPSPVPQDLRQSLKTLATPSRLTHLFNYSFSILKALAVPKDTRQ